MTGEWIIAYDVADDRRRRRLAGLLEGAGVRIQGSVFRCRLSTQALRELRAAATGVLDPEADRVRWYALCAHCARRLQALGPERAAPDPPSSFTLV